MALKVINTDTVTSSVGQVDLTGISDNNIYFYTFANCQQVNDNTNVSMRLLDSGGSPITTTDYNMVGVSLCSDTTHRNLNGAGNDEGMLLEAGGNGSFETSNGNGYIFNAYKEDEYTHVTFENAHTNTATNLRGLNGGFIYENVQRVTGIRFLINSGNIDGGTFTLYKVV